MPCFWCADLTSQLPDAEPCCLGRLYQRTPRPGGGQNHARLLAPAWCGGHLGVPHRDRQPARPALPVVSQALLGREAPEAELPSLRRRACRGRRAPPSDQGRLPHAQGLPGGHEQGACRGGRAQLRCCDPCHAAWVPVGRVAARDQGHVAAQYPLRLRDDMQAPRHPAPGISAAAEAHRLADQRSLRPPTQRGACLRPGRPCARLGAPRACRPASRLPRCRVLGETCGQPRRVRRSPQGQRRTRRTFGLECRAARRLPCQCQERSSLCPLAPVGHDRHETRRGPGAALGGPRHGAGPGLDPSRLGAGQWRSHHLRAQDQAR
jgi:hypothetical protein